MFLVGQTTIWEEHEVIPKHLGIWLDRKIAKSQLPKCCQSKEKCPRSHVGSSFENVEGLLMLHKVPSKTNYYDIKIHSSVGKEMTAKSWGCGRL